MSRDSDEHLLTSGSHHRLQQFIRKAMAGPEITISTIGGSSESSSHAKLTSVTKGHQVQKDEIWFHRFAHWLGYFVGENVTIHEVNGAAPGKSIFLGDAQLTQ